MTIPTQMSLAGFIATAPDLHFTRHGAARFYARVGVEHYRKEVDGSVHQARPDLPRPGDVQRHRAERAYARFKKGDPFLASGYIHEYEVESQRPVESRDQFVARRIGHDSHAPSTR